MFGVRCFPLVPRSIDSPLQPASCWEYKRVMKEPRQVQCRSSAKAFSLIELLVVLAVMIILTTLYWNHGPSKRDLALSACRQNLEKAYLALQIYSRDQGDKYPVVTNAVT